MKLFDFKSYRQILNIHRENSITYKRVLSEKPKRFSIIRHDVEFSPRRAMKIAEIDSELSVKSTFFFQVKNNAYNILSRENCKILERIKYLGMEIGLHFYVSHIKEDDNYALEKELNFQSLCINESLGSEISCFSYHRPPKWVLKDRRDFLHNKINAYGESFFEYTNDPKKIKYIADSQHQFKYGTPLDSEVLSKYDKFQILLHPDEWSQISVDSEKNFRNLELENLESFRDTLKMECNHFK